MNRSTGTFIWFESFSKNCVISATVRQCEKVTFSPGTRDDGGVDGTSAIELLELELVALTVVLAGAVGVIIVVAGGVVGPVITSRKLLSVLQPRASIARTVTWDVNSVFGVPENTPARDTVKTPEGVPATPDNPPLNRSNYSSTPYMSVLS